LGGHKVSVDGLNSIIKSATVEKLHIVDIGCGGGDSLRAFEKWSEKSGVDLKLSGIDLKKDCIDFCRNHAQEYSEIQFYCDDYRNISHQIQDADIVHAALFCHHLTENEIVELIRFCSEHNLILLINDLERNMIAYYSIKVLTKLFSNSYLVRNDAPLSVLRGFKKKEWIKMINKSGAENYIIKNKWAFRHLLIIYPNGK
ncbi:MAG: methyltransferase domain-containing protein, partial [Saprospiraceae bacterium]